MNFRAAHASGRAWILSTSVKRISHAKLRVSVRSLSSDSPQAWVIKG